MQRKPAAKALLHLKRRLPTFLRFAAQKIPLQIRSQPRSSNHREFLLQNRLTNCKLTSDLLKITGSVPEWLKGTGCKPVGVSLRWFESNPAHYFSTFVTPKRTMSLSFALTANTV